MKKQCLSRLIEMLSVLSSNYLIVFKKNLIVCKRQEFNQTALIPVDVKQVVAYFELTVVFHHLLILSKRPQLSPPFFNSVRREVKQRIGSP